jgi:hypothetical protein
MQRLQLADLFCEMCIIFSITWVDLVAASCDCIHGAFRANGVTLAVLNLDGAHDLTSRAGNPP